MYTLSTMFNQPAKCIAFYLDDDRIALAKSEALKNSDVQFVSTNDIITSGFFNACRSRLGWMGIDCRGRMDRIRGTYKTPGTIRTMLNSTPYKTLTKPFPSFCSWLCCQESASFGMVTNWSSFAEGLLQIDGCELDIHMPV